MAGYFQLDLGILKKQKEKQKSCLRFSFWFVKEFSKCAGKIKSAELQFPCGCIRVSPYENVRTCMYMCMCASMYVRVCVCYHRLFYNSGHVRYCMFLCRVSAFSPRSCVGPARARGDTQTQLKIIVIQASIFMKTRISVIERGTKE